MYQREIPESAKMVPERGIMLGAVVTYPSGESRGVMTTNLGVLLGDALSSILWTDEGIVRVYLYNGGQGSAEEIARAINRPVGNIRVALEALRSRGEITCNPAGPGKRGRPLLLYRRAHPRHRPTESVTRSGGEVHPSVWHRTKVDIAADYQHEILEHVCKAPNAGAIQRLARVTDSSHPPASACRNAFDHGLPSPAYGLTPLLWMPLSDWGPHERYVIRAYGMAGALVRGLKRNRSLEFSLGIDLWKKGVIVVGTGVEIGKLPEGVRAEMVFERLFFQLVGFLPRWCQYGNHRYFSDYHSQFHCLAHTDAGRQAQHRRGLISSAQKS